MKKPFPAFNNIIDNFGCEATNLQFCRACILKIKHKIGTFPKHFFDISLII